MNFRSSSDIDVSGKTVLLRLDLNIEASDPATIRRNFRVQTSLPILRDLVARGARTVILAHRGRPEGIDPDLSNAPLATALAAELGCDVAFVPHTLGADVERAITALKPGGILMTENLRFDPREEKNDKDFAAALAALGDIYVNDSFANCHRAHASMDAITAFLPHCAGPLLQKEVATLSGALNNMARPTAAIIGGAKISTKLALIENLLDKIDVLFVGGAMANTFLVAEGIDVQKSLFEPALVPAASSILAQAHTHNCQILLPHDAIIADSVDGKGIAAPCMHIPPGGMILDIGPATIARLTALLTDCRTLLWNGPVGLFEKPEFAAGTLAVARLVAARTRDHQMVSIAGGGDTVAALQAANVVDDLTYVSTAGGAFLEFLEGKQLPGLVALQR